MSGHFSQAQIERTLKGMFDQLKQWSLVWGYPSLPRVLNIEFMDPNEQDLGKCHVPTNTVWLNGSLLLPGKEALLLETLCHEAAHWIAFQRHRMGIDPHGVEWQGFMRKAGYEPRAVLKASECLGPET